MNRVLLSIGIIFSFSIVPAFAQDGADRVVEEIVGTGLRKESNLSQTR